MGQFPLNVEVNRRGGIGCDLEQAINLLSHKSLRVGIHFHYNRLTLAGDCLTVGGICVTV